MLLIFFEPFFFDETYENILVTQYRLSYLLKYDQNKKTLIT